MELLAEATTAIDVNAWTAILSPLGVAGILAWFLYYTTSVATPQLMARVDAICANHDKSQKESIIAFRDEMKTQREEYRADLHIIMDSVQCRNFQPLKGNV